MGLKAHHARWATSLGMVQRSAKVLGHWRRCIHTAVTVKVPTSESMERLGGFFGGSAAVGSVVLLDGVVGSGKSCFARGFVRAAIGNPAEIVISPTFLLQQTYGDSCRVHHYDLHRLGGEEAGTVLSEVDVEALGLAEALAEGICIVEWPSPLRPLLGEEVVRLTVELSIESAKEGTGETSDSRQKEAMCDLLEDFDQDPRVVKLQLFGGKGGERNLWVPTQLINSGFEILPTRN